MATIFRSPGWGSVRQAPLKAPAFDSPNLLLSVLVATTPFQPVQLPPPAKPPYVHRHIDTPDLLANTLVPTVPFFAPETIRVAKPAYIQRYFDPPNLSFALPVVSLSPPFPSFDWPPVRLAYPKAPAFDPPNLILSEFVVVRPFFEPLWPGPTPPRPKASPWDLPGVPYGVVAPPVIAPPVNSVLRSGYPPVPEYMPDEKEHRRQIVRAVNGLRQGKFNITQDVTLRAGQTTTTLTDARIGISSAIVPAMPTTANGAAALVAGIYVSNIKSGSATINHASNAAVDQTLRFLILG